MMITDRELHYIIPSRLEFWKLLWYWWLVWVTFIIFQYDWAVNRRLCWSKLSRATIWSYRSLNRLLTTTITFSLSIVPSLLVRKRGGPLCHKNIVARFFCGSMCITWDGVNVVLLLALVLFLTLTSSLATSTTRGHWYSFDGRANNSRGLEL